MVIFTVSFFLKVFAKKNTVKKLQNSLIFPFKVKKSEYLEIQNWKISTSKLEKLKFNLRDSNSNEISYFTKLS